METRPDDFHSPKPKQAPASSVVNAVLAAAANVGMTVLSLLSGLLAAALILYSGYVLYDTFYTQEKAKSGWDLLQYKPSIVERGDEDVPADLKNLLADVNDDYRAWLTVYETGIDYPVMQGSDDLYYAYHDIYRETSLTGAIYLAAANKPDMSDSYDLIYGHHMDNGAMFGGLDLYEQESYFNSHREGILVAQSAVYDLYAFAVAQTDAYQDRIYTVGDRMDDVAAFLRGNTGDADSAGTDWSADTLTLFFDEAPLTGAERIVALSTCASANTNGRLLVFFVATERDLGAMAQATPTPTPGPEATPRPTARPVAADTEENGSPLSKLFGMFEPRGASRDVWALLNLLSLIVTVYLFLPLLHLGAKFGRAGKMKKINESKLQLLGLTKVAAEEAGDLARLKELVAAARLKQTEPLVGDIGAGEFGAAVETLFYRTKPFLRRFWIGMGLELLFSAAAVIAFILTQNLRQPMVLIDRWTPLMILLMLIVWALDVRLIRYRNKVLADEEEAERRRQAQEQA